MPVRRAKTVVKAAFFLAWSIALTSLGGWGGWKVRAAADPILDSRDRAESVVNMFMPGEGQ